MRVEFKLDIDRQLYLIVDNNPLVKFNYEEANQLYYQLGELLQAYKKVEIGKLEQRLNYLKGLK